MVEPTNKSFLEIKRSDEEARSPTFIHVKAEDDTNIEIGHSTKSETDERRYLQLLEHKRRDEEARSPTFFHVDPQPYAKVKRVPKSLLATFNDGDVTENKDLPVPELQSELVSSSMTCQSTLGNLQNTANVSDFYKDFLPITSVSSDSTEMHKSPNQTSAAINVDQSMSSKLADMKKVFLDASMNAKVESVKHKCAADTPNFCRNCDKRLKSKDIGICKLDLTMLDEFKGFASLKDVLEAGRRRRIANELDQLSIVDQNVEVPDIRFLWQNKKER